MNRNSMNKWLSIMGCIVLIAAMALSITGCGSNQEASTEKTFTLLVVDGTGAETSFEITSSKKTVGEALMDEKLLEGEQGEYGLYVKAVNGITADYDVDGTYWCFYINGEYAMTGVDQTEIEDGGSYMFKVESGT